MAISILSTQKKKKKPLTHITSIPVLHELAVESSSESKRVRILDELGRNNHGTERVKGIEALAKAPLASTQLCLPFAGRNVIRHRIAFHDTQYISTS